MTRLLEDAQHSETGSAPRVDAFHAVLTRFNARVGFAEPPSAQWLRHRIEIFRRVCMPSLLAQRLKPNVWLLLLDGSEQEPLDPLLRLIEPFPWIAPVWQDLSGAKPEQITDCFGRALSSFLPIDHEYIVTTRLDNDDALSRDYIQIVTDYIGSALSKHRGMSDFWLSFPFGAQLHASDLRFYVHSRSHFLTRCQTAAFFERDTRETAITIRHGDLFHAERTVFTPLTDYPMWLQYVHDQNVSNRVRTAAPIIKNVDSLYRWFGIRLEDLATPHPSSAEHGMGPT